MGERQQRAVRDDAIWANPLWCCEAENCREEPQSVNLIFALRALAALKVLGEGRVQDPHRRWAAFAKLLRYHSRSAGLPGAPHHQGGRSAALRCVEHRRLI